VRSVNLVYERDDAVMYNFGISTGTANFTSCTILPPPLLLAVIAITAFQNISISAFLILMT